MSSSGFAKAGNMKKIECWAGGGEEFYRECFSFCHVTVFHAFFCKRIGTIPSFLILKNIKWVGQRDGGVRSCRSL